MPQSDSVIVKSFIVFKPDSIYAFAGVHLQVVFPHSFLELDTLKPGFFITDTSQATPLFTYSYDGDDTIDIFAYFLDTVKLDIEGTGHLADIIFSPSSTGSDSVKYNLKSCEIIDHDDNTIELRGDRGAAVIVE